MFYHLVVVIPLTRHPQGVFRSWKSIISKPLHSVHLQLLSFAILYLPLPPICRLQDASLWGILLHGRASFAPGKGVASIGGHDWVAEWYLRGVTIEWIFGLESAEAVIGGGGSGGGGRRWLVDELVVLAEKELIVIRIKGINHVMRIKIQF